MLDFITNLTVEQWIMFVISTCTVYLAFKLADIKINEIKQRGMKHYEMTSPSLISDFIKNRVWIASKDKLIFIKTTLKLNNIQWREDDIWLKIMNDLSNKTAIYIDEFSNLNTPFGDLWEMYGECFNMDDFAIDVKAKFFSIIDEDYAGLSKDVRTLKIYEIVDDISNIMLKYQMQASAKLLGKLKVQNSQLNNK